ncbi:ribosome silencing factor [Desulfovibrio inopinatus]|uniref:ribosome silencing factor n=1 Tax=Desulfovibrio inopinatus TaxID=102109 RepID=UPI0004299D44|nr:ribosome silencing factor [Desulfovibrio inopinatus]
MTTLDKAKIVASWLDEKKATDIVVLDVAGLCSIAEAMVIASAANLRQAKSLADDILKRCGEEGISFLGMEGYKNSQWILVDLNDVLVHVFLEEARSFYNIEGLWSQGTRIDLPGHTSHGEDE